MPTSNQFGFMAETWLRTFAVVVIGEFISAGANIYDLDMRALTAAIVAGLAKIAMNALNPNDPRYGKGATEAPGNTGEGA